MTTTDEIKEWLGKIGKSRAWLGEKLGVSKRTVDNWLSSAATCPPLKLQRIAELIDTEPLPTDILRQPLLVQPTREQFNRWNQAWRDSSADTLEEWAISGLDELADEALSSAPGKEPQAPFELPRVAEDATPYRTPAQKHG